MALKTDKAVEVFSAVNTGKIKNTEIEVAEARTAIQELAKNPNPQNRYEIAQIMAFSVNDILRNRENWLNLVADVKDVGINEKAMFKVRQPGIKAYIQAKGSTTARSKVTNKFMTLETEEVAARPYINYLELAAGKVNFDENISDAAYAMEIAKIQKIESVLRAAFPGYSTPNYASGSGVVKATLDAQIMAFSRLGSVSLLGDIAIIQKLGALTGFTAATNTQQFAPEIILEQNRNGYVGTYNTCNVVKLVNPPVMGSLDTPILNVDYLYIMPTGLEKSLKVVNEGDVTSLDQTNIDDGSYEVQLRQYFGAAYLIGNLNYLGVYEDTTL